MENIIDKLKEITGIRFEYYQRKFLERRIHFRVKNLEINSYKEYLDYLSAHPSESACFLDKFTINYTYFFRNYEIFERFEEFIRQFIVGLKRPIRIWSAPCATGEEPYSIAMLFDKLKKKIINFPEYEIVASDIDKTALAIAKNGVYGEYSIHEIPKNYVETYFTKRDTHLGPKFTLTDEIRNRVEFFEEDIIRGHKKNTKYDVIFCRNLLIYIQKEAKEKLLRNLANHLVHGGLLILGKTEMLMNTFSSFKSIDTNNHFYVKHQLSPDIVLKKEKVKKQLELDEKVKHEEPEKKGQLVKIMDKKGFNITPETKTVKIKTARVKKPVQGDKEDTIQSREKKLDQREVQTIHRLHQIEIKENQLKEKEQLLIQREIQLEQRELLIGLREKQLEQKIAEFGENEKKKISNKRGGPNNNQKGRGRKSVNPKLVASALPNSENSDQIIHPNIKGELNIPIGHYAIINSHNEGNQSTKFSIYGLTSGIALILADKVNKVYAISHIIEPKSKSKKNGSSLLFPHRYINTSVSSLLDNTLYHGANKENIEALVIGGAKNIYEKDNISQKNIDAIKKELFSKHIMIEKEFLGGISELSLLYDTVTNNLYVKKKWEEEFRKVYSN
ncbi:MAG: hypothetical protein EU532_12235 [Promethearchaeota archaeon]|nr:MAG: hypothetical protein EU532_12235 [Candidatus Lokiarchaeota archaeon]